MSDLIIYGTPLSPFVRTIRMLLEEVEEDYAIYDYMFGTEEMKAEHPMGKVPAMRDADLHLFETLAICTYLDEEYGGQDSFQPRDSVEKADMLQWISFYLDEGYPTLGQKLAIPRVLAPALGMPVDNAMVAENVPHAEKVLGVFDKGLRGKRFFVGDQMTLADMFIAPVMAYVKMTPEGQKMLPQFEHLSAWYTNMYTIESFKKTAPKPPGK